LLKFKIAEFTNGLLPYEDVDLFVDDVERQNAESVFLFDRAGGTVLVEGALRHLGEHLGHRVGPVLRFHFGEGKDVAAVGEELAPEEKVGEVNLESMFQNFSFPRH
jgi:hypothetical protein